MSDILGKVAKVLNHDRTRIAWVCRVVDGRIDKFARIAVQYPRDGAGRLTVAVTDFPADGPCIHHVGTASGYGYDKLAAAMVGARVGGVELGDHCDRKGRMLLRDAARASGWEVIGDVGGL